MSSPPKSSFTPTKLLELVPDHPLIRKHIPPDRTSNASMWSSEDSSLEIKTRARQVSLDVNKHAQYSKSNVPYPSKSAELNRNKNKCEEDSVQSGWGGPVNQDSTITNSSMQNITDIAMEWVPSTDASIVTWNAFPVQPKQEGTFMITESGTGWNVSTNQPTQKDAIDTSTNKQAWEAPDTQIMQENIATTTESVPSWNNSTNQSGLVQPAAAFTACGEHENIHGGWGAPFTEPNVACSSKKNEATGTQDTANLIEPVKSYHEPNCTSLQNQGFNVSPWSPAELLKDAKEQKEIPDFSDKTGEWVDYDQVANLDRSLEKLTNVHKQEKSKVQVDFSARDTLNETSKLNVVKDVSDEIGSNNLAENAEHVHVKPQKLNEGFRFKIEVDRNVYVKLILYKDSNVFEEIDRLEKTQNIRMENEVKAKLAVAIMKNIAMKIYNIEKSI